MYEHNALGYWPGLALCLTKVRSIRARCPATALIILDHRTWSHFIAETYFLYHIINKSAAEVDIAPALGKITKNVKYRSRAPLQGVL